MTTEGLPVYEDEDIRETALKVWQSMQPQIRKLAQKVAGFSNMYDAEELTYGLAYEAIYRGCLMFNKFRKISAIISMSKDHNGDLRKHLELLKNISKTMKIETFCYWYVMKVFFKEAGTNEVCYIVICPDGKVETYVNGEFRKKFNKEKIKELEKAGYKFATDRIFKVFTELCKENKDGSTIEPDIADRNSVDATFMKNYRRIIWG